MIGELFISVFCYLQESSPHIPPGSKIMSVEELERELTTSPPSSSSVSLSPNPQPHPQALSPSPSHQLPPPGIIQHPPPGLPHPLPPRPMQPHPFMPWPPGAPPGPLPPPHGLRPFPPPRVPIMRQGMLMPGKWDPPLPPISKLVRIVYWIRECHRILGL